MTIAEESNLRSELVTMNDVADFVDLFGPGTPFTPTLSATGSMTISSATGGSNLYWVLGNIVLAKYYITDIVLGGTTSSEMRATLPVTAASTGYMGGAAVGNPGVQSGNYLFQSTTLVGFRKYDSSNFTLGTINDLGGLIFYERA